MGICIVMSIGLNSRFLFYSLFVRLGDYDKSQNPDCSGNDKTDCAPPFEDYDVEYTIEHPVFINHDYYASMINDIALVRTKKNVLFRGRFFLLKESSDYKMFDLILFIYFRSHTTNLLASN